MKILARPHSGPSLSEAWLSGAPEARPFYPADPSSVESYRRKAEEVDRRFSGEAHTEIASYLTGGGDRGAERLDDFVRHRGFVVTTGQQPGLFGGPLYALYKGLTASALAQRLEAVLERPVLPVFWIGSEDHLWEEVRGTHVVSTANEIAEVALADRADLPSPSIHGIRLGPEIEGVLERFLELHPDTEFFQPWKDLLEDAYQPGVTLADGFERVMEKLLGPSGVFLVQAHHPDLKERSRLRLLRELGEARQRETSLRDTATAIESAGFDLQVPLLDGATNVFLDVEGSRERLFSDGDAFRPRGSDLRLTLAEIEAMSAADPAVLSPNVLLRPVVESAVLPTLSYVAGPGEASYFPQTTPVFEAHGIEPPVVHPRVGLFVVESKVDKVLAKFGLDLDRMATPHHELAGQLVREDVPPEIEGPLARLREQVSTGAAELTDALDTWDSTLKKPVATFRNQTHGLLDDVERKIVQSMKRQKEVTLAQVEKAQLHLFPLGRPQERVLNPFYYLVRYDQAFLDRVREHAAEAVLP